MKVLIIYYSQTGNTQKVARKIRDGVLAAGHQVYVVPVKNATVEMLDDYDMIGIGSPVWMADPPPVRRYLESIPKQDKKHAFLFCTHGTMPDFFAPVVSRLMQDKGFLMIGFRDWYGGCRIQVFPSPYYTDGHPDDKDLQEAEDFGSEVCRMSQAVRDGAEPPAMPSPKVHPMQALAVVNMLNGSDTPHCFLRRNESKCLHSKGCTICQDNCPMGYIDLDQGRFGCKTTHCGDGHGCTYCEMLCPSGAIESFGPTFEEKFPLGEHRSFGLFEEILNKAEAEGKFRRKIPKDCVETAAPYWSTSTHPRMRPLSTLEDNLPEDTTNDFDQNAKG